jgi:hypothetical protein
MIESDLEALVLSFRERLKDYQLSLALDYVKFNEWPLAIETLCDHLIDNDCTITQIEYEKILDASNKITPRLDSLTIRLIKELVK